MGCRDRPSAPTAPTAPRPAPTAPRPAPTAPALITQGEVEEFEGAGERERQSLVVALRLRPHRPSDFRSDVPQLLGERSEASERDGRADDLDFLPFQGQPPSISIRSFIVGPIFHPRMLRRRLAPRASRVPYPRAMLVGSLRPRDPRS